MTRMLTWVATLALVAGRLAAQTPSGPPPDRPRESPEGLLRLRDELSLSDQQLQRLRTLRQQAVDDRKARMGEMMDLRSKLMAREITGDDFRKELTRIRTANRDKATGDRGAALDQILTEPQRTKLAQVRLDGMRRRMMAMRRFGRGGFGRRGMRMGRQGWGGRGGFRRWGNGFGGDRSGRGFGPDRRGDSGDNGAGPGPMRRRPRPPEQDGSDSEKVERQL